ncbi:MAG: adenylosuccinate lyase [Spirochaetaceae bacterium]|nr:adenylosuccinate lyase [Spirochaetaceae bacterium]|tara:strand:- start:27588 stop:28886 length:1299 start_codon:yes stop_codon:yes gene_type:complete
MIDRYSHPEIAGIWTLENKYRIWLDVEIAVCEAWNKRGVVPDEDLKAIKEKADFNVQDILEIESRVHHDVIAFLTDVRDRIGPAGRWIHYGMTSSDVGDTALCMQLVQSADLLLKRLDALIEITRKLALQYKDQAMVGRTHGIHGEPTTLGMKFAHFYAELLRNKARLEGARSQIAVGKLSGAVGTFSNIDPDLEEEVCKSLGLSPEPVATQVVNRDRHAYFASVCGVIAGGLDRMANEIRLLQKSEGREVEEPFAKGQKGSSAMPHKRNPVVCERICGLARVVQSNVQVAYRDMPLWHERDISHSSAERVVLPDICIGLDYILERMIFVLSGLHVYPENMEKTLNVTRGLIFSQRLMLTLIDAGMLRDDAYDVVQSMSMKVWGDSSLHLKQACQDNPDVASKLSQEQIEQVFQLDYFLRNIDAIYKRLGLS